jgi:hypothetical protein
MHRTPIESAAVIDDPSSDQEPQGKRPQGEPASNAPEASAPVPRRPATSGPVQYKGAPLDAAKGPGLGCFWIQAVVVVVLLVLTPLSVAWNWPVAVSGVMLIVLLVLLLFAGQTVIFLLRLVAADRRAAGRRRPLGSSTKTIGELEDETTAGIDPSASPDAEVAGSGEPPDGGVRE